MSTYIHIEFINKLRKIKILWYFFLYSKALDMHIAVALLRISEGLDCSIGDAEEQKKNIQTIPGNQSFSQLSQGLYNT